CSSLIPGTPSNSRVPAPSVNGAMCRRSSSTRPADRYWLAVVAPPKIETSPSPAAARARSRADRMPSVTKWKVVPPSIGCGSRGWWVRTNTGAWNGGSSPHQPFHGRSQAPRTGPNMLRPIRNAPASVICSTSARFSSGVSNIQACSRAPVPSAPSSPNGRSSVWWRPAAYPSTETVRLQITLPVRAFIAVGLLVGRVMGGSRVVRAGARCGPSLGGLPPLPQHLQAQHDGTQHRHGPGNGHEHHVDRVPFIRKEEVHPSQGQGESRGDAPHP